MMDRALGAIATGTVAVETPEEAVKRFGMHYQWGRKDPFTPAMSSITWNNNPEVQIYKADGTAITKGTNGISGTPNEEFKLEDKVKTTINNLIQNPSTHYNLGDGTNQVPIASTEYYNTTKEGDWWNPTIKTIYDPCPNGYRIPKNGTYGTYSEVKPYRDWSEWLSSGLTSGRTFNKANPSFIPASGHRGYATGSFTSITSGGYYWMSTPGSIAQGSRLSFSSNAVYPNDSKKSYHSYGMSVRCIKE